MESEPAKIRVLLADDQDLIRRGLSAVLATDPDLEVVGEARNGREAVDLALALGPDVVLMDVRMPVMDGVAGTEEICRTCPQVKVLILTTFAERDYVSRALNVGASGYLLKDTPFEELSQAIRLVHKGYTQIGPGLAASALSQPTAGERTEFATWDVLSAREKDIVRLVADGRNNREIAQALHLAEKTVKNYITNILSQADLRDRTQLAIAVLRSGVLDSSNPTD